MEKSDFLKKEVPAARLEEYEDLVKLLLDHRSGMGHTTEEVAYWMAAACFGENHLWQDMKLANRKELSGLIAYHFRPLFQRNTGDMKWKKFF